MNKEQYKSFKKAAEDKGYKLWNVANSIQRESFYYYKGFAYQDSGERRAQYRVLFLVYDFTSNSCVPENDSFGVTPLVITESGQWPRIDLELTKDNFDIKDVEDYAKEFYNFVTDYERIRRGV